MSKINNMRELRENLMENLLKLQSGEIEPKVMQEINNAVGKTVNTVKVQIEGDTLLGKKRQIKFLDCD